MAIVAVIDVGSNSIKVAVVETSNQQELGRATEAVRIYQGGAEAGWIKNEVQLAAAQAIGRLVQFAREMGATRIAILATSAVRDAVNRAEFAACVQRETGLPVTIVSGATEARLAAAGVRADPAYRSYNNILAFDLGGGSLEVMTLCGKHCLLALSFPLGSVKLTHGFLRGGETLVDELDQASIRAHLLNILGTVVPSKVAESHLIIGAGGAFAAVALYLEAIGEPPAGGRLPVLRIRELCTRLCALNLEERRKVPGIPPERADIMPAALLTLCVLADLSGAEAFHLTHHGVRHGMVELLASQSGNLL